MLGANVLNNPDFQGVSVTRVSEALKRSQYADDITLYPDADHGFYVLYSFIIDYEAGSGTKVNIEKSETLFLGFRSDRTDSPLHVFFGWGNPRG